MIIYYAIIKNWFIFFGAIITGILLSVYLDTILRTKILGNKSNINTFVMLIGVLGEISVFGIFGFVLDPLVLIYGLKVLKEYFN